MAAVYGYETQPQNDRLVHVVDRMLKFTMHAMTPEREALAWTFPISACPTNLLSRIASWLTCANLLGSVQYIPTWMPGSQFRRDGLQCREYCKEMLEAPFEYTMDAIVSRVSLSRVSRVWYPDLMVFVGIGTCTVFDGHRSAIAICGT